MKLHARRRRGQVVDVGHRGHAVQGSGQGVVEIAINGRGVVRKREKARPGQQLLQERHRGGEPGSTDEDKVIRGHGLDGTFLAWSAGHLQRFFVNYACVIIGFKYFYVT